MELSINQSDLAKALKVLKKNLSKRTNLIELTHCHLKAVGDSVTLTVASPGISDGFSWVSANVPADVSVEGEVSTIASVLSNSVDSLPKGSALELRAEGSDLNISCNEVSLRLEAGNPENFPMPLYSDSSFTLVVDSGQTSSALKDCLAATTKDPVKASLYGVNLQTEGGAIKMAGCDGYRLSVCQLDDDAVTVEDVNFTIPLPVAKQIQSAIGAKPKTSKISFNIGDKYCKARYGNLIFYFPKLSADYPNYTQLTPQSFAGSVELDSDSFLSAAIRAKDFVTFNNRVDVGVNEDGTSITLSDADGRFSEKIKARVNGDFSKFSMNVSFLIDCLKTSAFSKKTVYVHMNGPTTPVVFSTGPEVNASSPYHLIMPIQAR